MKKYLLLALFLFPTLIFAQGMNHSSMSSMSHKNASVEAYKHVNHTMHMAMMREFTGDPDIDFVRGMIPHHQGAIDMAKVEQTYGTNGNIKNFANKVIRDQTKEILSMQGHLKRLEKNLEKNVSRNTDAIIAYRKADKKMHYSMNINFSGNADIDFVKGMIPHHKGAIDMARVVLEHGKDPNVRTLAWAIINAQDSEIYWMKTWLRKLQWRAHYLSS